jgi:hypothetical protein
MTPRLPNPPLAKSPDLPDPFVNDANIQGLREGQDLLPDKLEVPARLRKVMGGY